MNENNKLTDEQLDAVVAAAEADNNNQMQELKETVEVNPDAPLEAASVEVDLETNEIDLIAKQLDSDLDIDLFDAADPEKLEQVSSEKVASSIKSSLDLSDDEAYDFIKLVNDFRKDPNNTKVYTNLPEKIKTLVNNLLLEGKIDISHREDVARTILMEFMGNAEVDAAFVDLEKSLNEALQIPSIVDMYSEHTREVMEKNIPEMIEKIKDDEPEKAEMLAKVKDAYTRSYTFETVKQKYVESTPVRKVVRKHDIEFRHSLDNFNEMNSTTRFKMHDVFEVPNVLTKILCIDPMEQYTFYTANDMEVPESVQKLIDFKVTDADIQKFCVLMTTSCSNLDANDIIDASYMYYMTKNIIMLKHTQEAKTSFAAELINNICDVIALIRDKEAEFYAANPHLVKSKSSKKSRSARGGKK